MQNSVHTSFKQWGSLTKDTCLKVRSVNNMTKGNFASHDQIFIDLTRINYMLSSTKAYVM